MKKLSEGAVDAVVIAVPASGLPEGIQVIRLFEDELYFASSKNKKPKQAEIDLSEYQNEKFLTLQDGFATTSGFYEAFKLAGLSPNVVMKVGDIFSPHEYGFQRYGDDAIAGQGEGAYGGCN
ncbi:LysR substrate-binding domain-containing protein [Polynucleobacter necessarius]|uniref:LysR substrate-binding domain-containing protein n=1 Tax=Polynucleobacter necessarius TaxID=576610 RepID=UPI000FE1ACB9|nr:LysR substrate-binding domain-containing protein [Polynucleobacter necessarius]